MGPGDGGGDFVVEEPNPEVYNLTGADPPIWEPPPEDILLMFQQLETEKVLPLNWVCTGRRPPEKEPAEQEMEPPSEEEDDDFDKMEEKQAPEPSAFDFDDTASESSTRLVPRTPVSSAKKRPEKRVARMDNILSSIRRQQKAEREARKSFPRGQGASPFRGGTPSRMAGFSPGSTPVSSRFSTSATSPRPGGPTSPRLSAPLESTPTRLGHPAGSPSLPRPAGSPSSSRLGGHSGSPPTSKPASQGSSPRPAGSPSAARGPASNTTSPKGAGSPAAAVMTPTSSDTLAANQPPGLSSAHPAGAESASGMDAVVPRSGAASSVTGKGLGDGSVKTEPAPMDTSSGGADVGREPNKT